MSESVVGIGEGWLRVPMMDAKRTVSISVVFSVSFPVLPAPAAAPAAGRSISISTTSPSIISVSSLIRTPIERRKACVSASARREKRGESEESGEW